MPRQVQADLPLSGIHMCATSWQLNRFALGKSGLSNGFGTVGPLRLWNRGAIVVSQIPVCREGIHSPLGLSSHSCGPSDTAILCWKTLPNPVV